MEDPQTTNGGGWLEASGLVHIIRVLGLAIQPAKLGLALAAIVVTVLLGSALDTMWGANGVDARAVSRYVASRAQQVPFDDRDGVSGIFEVWQAHQKRCVVGFLCSSLPGRSLMAGTSVGTYISSQSAMNPLQNLAGMVHGVSWMARYHTLYFVLFGLGSLLIWSLAGGAICRLAAVQFVRDERLSIREGLRFAWDKLFGGFFLAPCIPLIFMLIVAVLLVLGGMLLRLPFLGDLLAGAAFFLAILGGFVIAILALGLLVGGSLFFPVVSMEGSDAFDAFSRGLSYPFSKPWKAALYAAIATVFGGICWVFVQQFTSCMLGITRSVVAFGTSPFGWWSRGGEGESLAKLDLLWPVTAGGGPYTAPVWSTLSANEYLSAALIGVYVLLTIGLMWSFLASFYFSASTVIYALLRRDVDGTDLEDVFMDPDTEAGSGFTALDAERSTESPEPTTPPAADVAADISMPVVSETAATLPAEPETSADTEVGSNDDSADSSPTEPYGSADDDA